VENAKIIGKYLLDNLYDLQNEFPEFVSQARGLGLLCAFNMPNPDIRKNFLAELYNNKMIMLGCGQQTVRFRTPLTVTKDEIDKGISIIKGVMYKL